MNNQIPAARILLLLLAVYLGIAAYIALQAPHEVTAFLYSEQGPYEVFSAWLWLLLGVISLCSRALQPRTRIAAGLAALLMGARELDMHKSLFSMSFIKTNFYKSADIPLHDKLEGGVILLALLALVLYLLVRMVQHLRRRGISDTSALLLLTALVLGAGSKVLDRFSSQMHELFQIDVSAGVRQMVMVMEESLEMTMPLLLILALLTYRRSTR